MRHEGTTRASGASSTSVAISPGTDPMRTPGGLVLAVANIDTGGAGPNGSDSRGGWRFIATGGTNIAAYCPLPLDAIVTPPTITLLCSRADTWAGVVAYVS